jgi:hypothetical protein
LLLLSAAVVRLQVVRERWFPQAEPAQQILYVSSPAVMTRLALSYDAVVSDLYWIRAIQYYGGTRLNDHRTSRTNCCIHCSISQPRSTRISTSHTSSAHSFCRRRSRAGPDGRIWRFACWKRASRRGPIAGNTL